MILGKKVSMDVLNVRNVLNDAERAKNAIDETCRIFSAEFFCANYGINHIKSILYISE